MAQTAFLCGAGIEQRQMSRVSDTRRKKQRRQRLSALASAKGECVFEALLAGVEGLQDATHLRTHTGLLKSIRAKLKKHPAALELVEWNGEMLSTKLASEFREAVLQHVHVGNGYFCSACDALLAAYCVTLHLNVEHCFAGTPTRYDAPAARRTVHLSSSLGHMEHEYNQDHPVESQVRRKVLTSVEVEGELRLNDGAVEAFGECAALDRQEEVSPDLTQMRISALRKRAVALGIDDGSLEQADDAEDTKAALIALILPPKAIDLEA